MTTRRPAARRTTTHSAGFWIIAAAFTICMAFSTVPTPLYAIYRERDGFPTWVITVIFAAYAVGVALSLYLAGHVSDWLGRRRVILTAVIIEIVAAIIFLLWPEVPGLIIARFVCGVGIGVLTATATAHLSELRAYAKPQSAPSAVVSSFANIGGLSFGPLIAGVLAQWVVAPLVVPYVVFLVLLVLAAIGVALVPETVERREERRAYRPQRVAIPADARGAFFAAGGGAAAGFAVLGFFTALTPTILATSMHETSRFVAGIATFAVFIAAALTQIATIRWRTRTQLQFALVAVVVGILLLGGGVVLGALWLFVIAGVIAGAGVGVLFRSSIAVAAGLAPADRRGEVLAAIFLIAYIGLAVPVLLIGVALISVSLVTVLLVFAVVVLVLVCVATPRMIARTAS
jgi:MFS family permease